MSPVCYRLQIEDFRFFFDMVQIKCSVFEKKKKQFPLFIPEGEQLNKY